MEEECRKKEAVRAEIQATYLEIEKDLNNWDDTQKELTEQIQYFFTKRFTLAFCLFNFFFL